MENEFILFRRFKNMVQAQDARQLLADNGIDAVIATNAAPVDVTFVGNTFLDQIEIKIPKYDFARAEKILEKRAEEEIVEVEEDYYLLQFSDDELYDVLLKADEWNEYDYVLAQKLLKERGRPVDKELLDKLKKERLEELAKPDGNQQLWIILGYLFAVVGGLFGIVIGYFLWTSKKTLPNGESVFTYSQNDRQHGKNIFIIGLVAIPIIFLLKALR